MYVLHEEQKKSFREDAVNCLQHFMEEYDKMSPEKQKDLCVKWYNLILSIQYIINNVEGMNDLAIRQKGLNAMLELKSGGFDQICGVLLYAHDKWI